MSFSAAWLALREPVDHASRAPELAAKVRAHFAGHARVRVVDLGCGTGSNLRATSALLGAEQHWTLVDYDPALLAAARQRLTEWADAARADTDALVLVKAGKTLTVRFVEADLNRDLAAVLSGAPDLVTASALFDLISERWIAEFARAVREAGAAFYTVLTYDGRDAFAPAHPLDAAITAAFARHQKSDKGFGVAAGPDGADVLARQFRAAGFTVAEGDSPWRIGPDNAALARDLLAGIANAVGETGVIPDADLAAWLAFRLAQVEGAGALLLTGHRDTFAVVA